MSDASRLLELEKAITKVGDLPVVPEVVSEVLRLTDDPDVALQAVSDEIQRDPAITAKLLRVSNSPYYGMKQAVGTLKLALVILGVREVRNIVLGISVMDALRNERTERLLQKSDFWNHSALVGGLARKLGTHFRLGLQGEDFIAGLLHDIGKLLLWRQLDGAYESVFVASGGHSMRLCEAERAAFGFDHADAAALLANKWNMPETLRDALAFHHDGDGRSLESAKDPRLAAVVRIANYAARDDWSAESAEGIQSLTDNAAWDLVCHGLVFSTEERRELLAGFMDQLDEAPALSL